MSAKWKYAAMVLILMKQLFSQLNLSGYGQILPGAFCSVHDNLISGHLHISSSKCYCILIFIFKKSLDLGLLLSLNHLFFEFVSSKTHPSAHQLYKNAMHIPRSLSDSLVSISLGPYVQSFHAIPSFNIFDEL